MRIVFIRHGESEANTQKIISNTGYTHGLTENGYAQATNLVKKLKINIRILPRSFQVL
ncbi:phosphoglycerate mutase family protein [Spirochaeta isovalerica]|uniref:histidine phosphatase family protein n=1 Tax=Spirochaeta isovalerica TaxID=150 RepID=UPI001C87E80A